ncbi:unnamed protein product, partial [Nesidiocoris tenuis]
MNRQLEIASSRRFGCLTTPPPDWRNTPENAENFQRSPSRCTNAGITGRRIRIQLVLKKIRRRASPIIEIATD